MTLARVATSLTDFMTGAPAAADVAVYRDGAWVPGKKAVFDVRDYGARTSATDNRAAVQAAIAAAEATCGTVWVPELYAIRSVGGTVGFGSRKPYALRVAGDDVGFAGPGGFDFGGLRAIAGDEYHGIVVGTDAGLAGLLTNLPTHPLAGSYAKGVRTLTLANAADAANYRPGDWVYLRTGQVLASGTAQPDCEANRLLAVDGADLILRWPTSKPYAPEWFLSGTQGYTSTVPTANAAVFGVANLSWPARYVVERPSLRGLTLVADSGYALVSAFHPFGFVHEDLDAHLAGALFQGAGRGARLRRVTCHLDPPTDRQTQTFWVAVDTKSVDFMVDECDFTSSGAGWFHGREGAAQVTVRNSRLSRADGATDYQGTALATVEVGFRGYDYDLAGLTIRGSGPGNTPAIRVDGRCNGGGRIRGCDVDGTASTVAVSIGSDNWHVAGDNRPNGRAVRRAIDRTTVGAQANAGVVPAEPVTLQGWLTPAQPAIALGTVPAESILVGRQVLVNTAFNPSGSCQVKVGYDGTATTEQAFVGLTDVKTAGAMPVAAAPGLLNSYLDVPQTAKAWIVVGSGSATVGRVHVTLTYAPAMLRP